MKPNGMTTLFLLQLQYLSKLNVNSKLIGKFIDDWLLVIFGAFKYIPFGFHFSKGIDKNLNVRIPVILTRGVWIKIECPITALKGRHFSSLITAEGRFARRNVSDSATEIPY